MKKAMSIGVKPLAMATALIAGTSVSMIAAALPGGGDTLGAAKVTTETTCQRSVDMTISGAARSVTTGTGTCQIRTLPPTVGFVVTDTTPAGATVSDSSAMVSAGGELYEAYVGGKRDAAVLLTPNRALATSRSIAFASGAGGSTAVDFAATVQPATALEATWLTGKYRIMSRNHDYTSAASNLEQSNGVLNPGLSEFNYTKSTEVQFNGNGTCAVTDVDSHMMFTIVKDPTLSAGVLEMDNGCTDGGGDCAQNDGSNYIMTGGVNIGSTGLAVPPADWVDANADGQSLFDAGCTYSVAGDEVTVNYHLAYGVTGQLPATGGDLVWSTTYNVSADLRYIVANGDSSTDFGGMAAQTTHKGGIAVGVRVGSPVVEGKTYLFNALDAYNTTSTPVTASYENPLTPTYQQEKCASRGSLTLNAAGACTYTAVSTCNARFKSGYEESAIGANDGTITDSVTVLDGVPVTTSCSWSGTGTDLVVDLGMQNQGGDPITMHYTGAASDNGEALVMQGIYNVIATAPDTENAPLLAAQQYDMQSYMVAQEYTGDLNANVDADALNNLQEFTYSDDRTRTGSVRSDFDADGDSDIYFRNLANGQSMVMKIQNASAVSSTSLGFTNAGYTVIDFGDLDADGDKDIVLRNPSAGQTIALVMQNGLVQSTSSYGFNNTGYALVGLGDADGDGDDDLYFRNAATGQQIITLSQNHLPVATNSLGFNNTGFVFKGLGDADSDGDADMYFRNDTTGQQTLLKVQAGLNAGTVNLGFNATGFVVKALGDADGDGSDDIFFRNDTTGQQTIMKVQAGAAAGMVSLGFNATTFAFKALADSDGDGDVDMYFRNDSSGQQVLMNIQNAASAGTANLGFNATTWSMVGTGDYDGDNDADILFRKSSNGENAVMKLQGNVSAGTGSLGLNATTWTAYTEAK